MKTVYDLFIDFAYSLLGGTNEYDVKKIERGISDYLNVRGVHSLTKDADKIVQRELTRFRGISPQAFSAFFETYDIRSRIVRFKDECDMLAIDRLRHNKQISKEAYTDRIERFFKLASEIAGDRRYTAWLDEISHDVTVNLEFASGQSNKVCEDTVEKYKWILSTENSEER